DGDPRIGLSRKATETDPWEVVNEQFAVGETVEGTVVRNAPFGAFVELAPGVEGLVHVSEMSWTEHVRTPDEVVEPGDVVNVEIQDIDIRKKRISLSMKAAEGDPWEEVTDHYAPGMQVEGEVENIEDFGVFVRLPTGITALMPRSEMNLPNGVMPHRRFTEGEQVAAEVLNIDPGEREMALTIPRDEQDDAVESNEEPDQEPTPQTDHAGDGGSFGTLGDQIGDIDLD
ncbi:MAG: S1 RNA-binding domain-containing protein, partial [Bradymonadaceae bacterium]